MYLIEKRHRVVALGDLDDVLNWGDVAIHGVYRLKGHQLCPSRIVFGKQTIEIGGIVVPKDTFIRTTIADTFDHRIMVVRIRINDALGNFSAKCGQCRHVSDITRGEQKSPFGFMQVRELLLKQDVIVVCPSYISCAAGTGAALAKRRSHSLQHCRMLSHPEIVVGAPNSHLADGCSIMTPLPAEILPPCA